MALTTVFTVRACAGKGRFSASLISTNPLVLKLGINAMPTQGKANRALLSELGKMLRCKVSILAGHKSRRKTLAAECTIEHLLQEVEKDNKR